MSLQYLECPFCGCPMTCLGSFGFHMFEGCQTEKHKAKQKEYDDGIIHDRKCKIVMIDVPKLVINPQLTNKE